MLCFRAVSAATSTLTFPILQWILQVAVIAYFIGVALYLSTVGHPIYRVRNFDVANCKCNNEGELYKVS